MITKPIENLHTDIGLAEKFFKCSINKRKLKTEHRSTYINGLGRNIFQNVNRKIEKNENRKKICLQIRLGPKHKHQVVQSRFRKNSNIKWSKVGVAKIPTSICPKSVSQGFQHQVVQSRCRKNSNIKSSKIGFARIRTSSGPKSVSQKFKYQVDSIR